MCHIDASRCNPGPETGYTSTVGRSSVSCALKRFVFLCLCIQVQQLNGGTWVSYGNIRIKGLGPFHESLCPCGKVSFHCYSFGTSLFLDCVFVVVVLQQSKVCLSDFSSDSLSFWYCSLLQQKICVMCYYVFQQQNFVQGTGLFLNKKEKGGVPFSGYFKL